jgi:hypothetical protein
MTRTKIFLDTEFTGLRADTTLISIGLISEDGKTFYAEFNDYDESQILEQEKKGDYFIRDNVILNLKFNNTNERLTDFYDNMEVKANKECIKNYLENWLSHFDNVEIWSDVLNYDWTLFRDLFHEELPENVYYIPFDMATLFKIKGIDPDINRKEFIWAKDFGVEHNALVDARIIKMCYEKVMGD